MIIEKPQLQTYKPLRIYDSTHALLKAIAKHYRVPMTVLVHQIATNIAKANGIIEENL